MKENEEHLSGADLEALAANQPPSSDNAAGHLAACTRCHDALSAMRAENRLFASEFAQENDSMELAVDRTGQTSRPLSHVNNPFVMYTIAASIMLACALALIWNGKRQPDEADPKTAAQQKEPPAPPEVANKARAAELPETTKADGDAPKTEAPKDGEAVYEGKTAKQWLAELDNENNAGQVSEKAQKPRHALLQLGKDAFPAIFNQLRNPNATNLDFIRVQILGGMTLDKTDLALITPLLKDEHFAVRRGAVELLGSLADAKPELRATAQAALAEALKDRDKAVVEAARDVQSRLEALAISTKTEELIATAKAALQAKDFDKAAKSVDEAERIMGNNARIAELRAMIDAEKAKLKKTEILALVNSASDLAKSGRLDEAYNFTTNALKVVPDDPAAQKLLAEIKAKLTTEQKVKADAEQRAKVAAERQAKLAELQRAVKVATDEYNVAVNDPFGKADVDSAKKKLDAAKAALGGAQKPVTRIGEPDIDDGGSQAPAPPPVNGAKTAPQGKKRSVGEGTVDD